MSQYFPTLFRSGRNISIKDDLSNYATILDLKNVTNVDTLRFCTKNKSS